MAKRTIPSSAASQRVVRRARLLIEQMLKEMQQGLDDPDHLASEAWEKLFGPKQSMVANLQKLVASLAVLPDMAVEQAKAVPCIQEITPQEMKLLKLWLEETGVDDGQGG